MLKVYGINGSRAARTMWLCRELGLDYQQVPVNFADPNTKSPEFLSVNPSGKIPAIDDNGFRLWESMAINIYLAKKHDSPLMPKDLIGEALVLQWSFWVMTEVEKPLLTAMLQRRAPHADPQAERHFRDRNPRNPELEEFSILALQRPFGVLDRHLVMRDYLLGINFTLADLNVACVMDWANHAQLDLSTFPNVLRWLERCMSRGAARG